MKKNGISASRAASQCGQPVTAPAASEPYGRATLQGRRFWSRGPHGQSIALLAYALLTACGLAQANVGRTTGTYYVNQNGAATYTIPIFAPRGPNGLEPHISLTYDSQSTPDYVGEDNHGIDLPNGSLSLAYTSSLGSSDGLQVSVGAGWSIAGLSEIYRCDKTVAQDGTSAAIALTTSDGYCLDGQRLRLTSGTYGTAGSVYQTEIANFSQVTADGTAGSGPAYFVAQGKDGLTYEYGNGGNSQVLAGSGSTAWQWWLDKVSDRAGNTMTISYRTDYSASEALPQTISWTPSSHGVTQYNYTMEFKYSSASLATSGWAAGFEYKNWGLLQSVAINQSGATIRDYFLSYQTSSATNRELLTQIKECADSTQTDCLSPTAFNYQNSQPGVATSTTAAATGVSSNLASHYDFNGDGRDDLAYCNGSNPNVIEVALSSSSGYGTPVNTGIACGALYADLLGNGKDGIVANSGGTWYYYTWNGSSFGATSTGIAYDSSATQYMLADVNGDGLPDLIESMQCSGCNLNIYVRLNTSSGSSPSFSGTNAQWYSAPYYTYFNGAPTYLTGALVQSNTDAQYGDLRKLDFDGDGRADLAIELQEQQKNSLGQTINFTQIYELISTGTGFGSTVIATEASTGYYPVGFMNFNSDKCTDYLLPGAYDNNSTPTIYISGCNSSNPTTLQLPQYTNVLGVTDWNDDGRDDILVSDGSTIGVYLSQSDSASDSVSSLIQTSVPYSAASTYFTFDATGASRDLGVWSGSSVNYYADNSVGHPPDILTKITDGYGNWIAPTYVSIAQGLNSTYFAWNDAQYPYQDYLGPFYVVSQTTFNDPSHPAANATYQQSDYYAGAWMNLEGRGFAGFGAHQIADSRNGIYETLDYDRSFPYTGMLTLDTATQNNNSNQTIFWRSYTTAETALDNTQYNERYFTYVSGATDKDYQVGGTTNGSLISTSTSSFSFDSYGNLTSSSKTITDNDPGSSYNGYSWTTAVNNTPDVDGSTWCLPLLTESQVTYSDTFDNGSITLTRQFPQPDTTYCRYTQVVTAPNTNYQVTETLGYDAFGNINSDILTGTGMSPRQSTANWGSTGQFPVSLQDPVGYADGYETQIGYDYRFGLKSSEVVQTTGGVQNTPPTQWSYDPFGRLETETRPDNTSTAWSYSLYSGADPKPRMVITQQQRDTGGNVINTTTDQFDMADRLYVEEKTLLDGSTAIAVCRAFDSLGRITLDEVPYQGNQVGAYSYSYDILNRVTQVQRPTNQSDGTLVTTTFNYSGHTTQITDGNSDTHTLVRDVNGWLRSTTDDKGYQVIFGYDAAGSRNKATDNQSNVLWTGTWAYGISQFLTGETNIDSGAWGYTVDPLGERTAWTDPKGQNFSEQYDALSRPYTRSEPAAANDAGLFTQWTWGSTASSHNIGQLQAVCTGPASASSCSGSNYSESWTYDGDGRPYQRSIVLPSLGTYTYTWQYSATTGFLNTLTYPTGPNGALNLQYAYQYGYLQSITDTLDSPNVVVWKADAMNPAGQITQEALGNGIVTNRSLDGVTHFLNSVQSGLGGGTGVQNLGFLYDAVGDVTQRQDNNLGLTEDFYYDGDDRLDHSTLNGTPNLQMQYDNGAAGPGNITSRSDVASGATWTYDSNHKHQVTEAGSTAYMYSYDANGNMSSRAGSNISWTSYNYPSTISDSATGESVSYSYAADRTPWLESTKEPSGSISTYCVGELMQIVVGTSTTYRNYIYAGHEPVAVDERTSSSSNFYYFHTDQQGSISAITNSSGQTSVNESFTAFGARRNPTTWSGTPSSSDLTTISGITQHGYTFQRALGEQMGLNNMVGRVQDAVTGRFISADPYIFDTPNTQDWNPYSYVYNNPLTYTDPSGYKTCTFVTETADAPAGSATVYFDGKPAATGQSGSPAAGPSGYEVCGDFTLDAPANGPAGGSGGGKTATFNTPQQQSNPQKPNQQQCTAAQQQAAQLAGALDDYSHLSGLFALGTGLAAAISGAGEGVTFGVDTPVTISFGSATAFFATESAITGGAAAALNSFASGNTAALASFDVSSLTDTAVSGIAEKIPGVGSYAEVAGQLAAEVADVVNAARGVCE